MTDTTTTTFDTLEVVQDVDRASTARGLVPSVREVESGEIEPYQFRPYTPVDESRIDILANVRGLIAQMNIHRVTAGGPVLPLLLIAWLPLITQLDTAATVIMGPEIQRDLGISLGTFGLVTTGFSAVILGGSPVMGWIADRARRTLMLSVGAVLGHIALLLRGLLPGMGGFLGASVLGTSSQLVANPAGNPLIADWYPPKTRGRVYAYMAIAGTIGTLTGPLIAGFVAANLGWRATLMLLGGIAAAVSLSLFLLKEPVRGGMDRLAMGADAETASHEQRAFGWTESWRAAWSVKTLRLFCYKAPFDGAWVAGWPLLSGFFLANHYHLSIPVRGLLGSLSVIPAFIALALSGPIADRILAFKPERIAIYVGVLVLASVGAVLGFVWIPSIAVALGCAMFLAFVLSLIGPATTAVTSLVVPARIRGLGAQMVAIWSVPGIVAPIVVGYIADAGGLQVALTALTPALVIAAFFMFSARRCIEQDIRAGIAASMADEAYRRSKAEGRTKLLVCRDIDITYDGAQVLFGVDFDVDDGELIALLGTNGAGKSTLLRAIGGIQEASNGAVFLDGDDITHLPPHLIARRGVVTMPGGNAIFPTLTTEQNLKTALWMHRGDGDADARIEEVLQRFPRLRERWHTQAGNLSGGEQQMIGLAQALLMKPRLLMIDELSLGLSPKVIETLLDALREINRQGTTVIIVEQSVNVALEIAERAVYMERGRVMFDGPVAELIRQPGIVRSVFLAGAGTADSIARGSERRLLELAQDEHEELLQMQSVSLSYGGWLALDDVNLTASRREVVGLIGPNGAGKTSVFDIITGFTKPDTGSIRFLDRDITVMAPDARARLGLARSYQNVRLFPALTVRENIAVALDRYLQAQRGEESGRAAPWRPLARRNERRVTRRVDNLVDSLGLGLYADKFLNELSTGTRRIVDIACLLAAQPSLLLLDEPSSGLAQAETEQLGPVIGRIVKETGCGVLIIEHDLGLAASVCHRMIAMRLGEVMVEGTPDEVLGNREVVDAILGSTSTAVNSRSIQLTAGGAGRASTDGD
jgi:ABC-type branched-subunit amino acid transport system ATPase component/MFS family permease